jgi:hypothetical protein
MMHRVVTFHVPPDIPLPIVIPSIFHIRTRNTYYVQPACAALHIYILFWLDSEQECFTATTVTAVTTNTRATTVANSIATATTNVGGHAVA